MSHIQHCQVLGPFNSGTSLMQVYLNRLFRNHTLTCFPYWKHSLPPLLYPIPRTSPWQGPQPESTDAFPGVLFVCMIRSPYFWAVSTCKHQYNMSFQTHSNGFGKRLRAPGVFRKRQGFTNMIQLWNRYYHQYESDLASKNQVLYVRLEDLVRTPLEVFEKLELVLERKPASNLEKVIREVSARPCKAKNAFGQVWEEKNSMEYLADSIDRRDLAFITSEVDQGLMKNFGYPQVWRTPEIGDSKYVV